MHTLLTTLTTLTTSALPQILLFGLCCQVVHAVDATPQDDAANNRYNVVFIAVDDLRPELGCYGETKAQSPQLDKFAKSGMLFQNHYVAVPTCGASRYALITGSSPFESGVTRSNEALYNGKSALKAEAIPAVQSMPEMFRRSGYHTVNIGKFSHTPDGRVFAYNGKGDGRPEIPHAWDELPTPFGSWERGWGTFFAYANGAHREDGKGHKDLMEFTVQRDEDLPDGLMAQTAIEQLKSLQKQKKPFFLGLGFFKPHLPFVAPKQDWDAFAQNPPLPPSNNEKIDSQYWHNSGEFYKYSTPYNKSNPLAPEDQITARRAYYACVRYVDRQIGKVLDAIDALKLNDNTIVVIWGDHGWHLGEQHIWAKHAPFERSVRSVLIVRVPGVTKPGTVSAALVETTDLYPTLIDMCAVKEQPTALPLSGASMRSLLDGSKATLRDTAISYWGDAITIRSTTHRLIASRKDNSVTPVELYDLSSVADTNDNSISSQPDVVKQMGKLLNERLGLTLVPAK